MSEFLGVRFRRAGPLYYFQAGGLVVNPGDQVVVDTARGLALGQVVITPEQLKAAQLREELKPVLRLASPEDRQRGEENLKRETEALARCHEKAVELGISMKVLTAEFALDASRLTINFSSEGRVDFRQLVRELAAIYRTRVELHQVGARDEAKLQGGFGRCGRSLCCGTFLTAFESVSIKMAKEQNLALNPQKLSGMCGRLMCCLGYELANYRALGELMPHPGEMVTTSLGTVRVVGTNFIKEMVAVMLESEAVVEVPLAEVQRLPEASRRRKGPRPPTQPQGENSPPQDIAN
ncbi:MAG: stage 0 sporulation family protein [Chloroflexi bacterium]|nr:stage 0 sporulation family protein [Chloroflexota bacterium]